jgi:hypothetical protein
MPLLHGVLDVFVYEAKVSDSCPQPWETAPRHRTCCVPAPCSPPSSTTTTPGHFVGAAQDLSSTYRIQVVGCMKRYICCGALPALAGSCDPYLCLDVGHTRCVNSNSRGWGHHNSTWLDTAVLLSTEPRAAVRSGRSPPSQPQSTCPPCCRVVVFLLQAVANALHRGHPQPSVE